MNLDATQSIELLMFLLVFLTLLGAYLKRRRIERRHNYILSRLRAQSPGSGWWL